MNRAGLLLAAGAIGIATPLVASAAPPTPFQVLANTASTISATGFRARIQVRPPVTQPAAYHWVGGFLHDGTFVQIGIGQASPGLGPNPQAFVWHQAAGSAPQWFALPGAQVGDWYDFEATKSGSVWSYRMTSPAGVTTTLLTATNASNLDVLQVSAETWMDGWGSFPTAAMRAIGVRSGATWSVPHLVFAPTDPICGEAEIYPTPGLNLVFRPTAGGSPCYVVLS